MQAFNLLSTTFVSKDWMTFRHFCYILCTCKFNSVEHFYMNPRAYNFWNIFKQKVNFLDEKEHSCMRRNAAALSWSTITLMLKVWVISERQMLRLTKKDIQAAPVILLRIYSNLPRSELNVKRVRIQSLNDFQQLLTVLPLCMYVCSDTCFCQFPFEYLDKCNEMWF